MPLIYVVIICDAGKLLPVGNGIIFQMTNNGLQKGKLRLNTMPAKICIGLRTPCQPKFIGLVSKIAMTLDASHLKGDIAGQVSRHSYEWVGVTVQKRKIHTELYDLRKV